MTDKEKFTELLKSFGGNIKPSSRGYLISFDENGKFKPKRGRNNFDMSSQAYWSFISPENQQLLINSDFDKITGREYIRLTAILGKARLDYHKSKRNK